MMRRKACFYKGQGLSLKPAPPPFFLALLFLLSILLLVNPSGESAGVSSPTPYRWTAGECITYQLTYDSSSSSDFRVLFGDVKSSESKQKEMPSGLAFSFQTTVRGELTSTVLGKRGDSNLIVYRIRNPLVTLIVNGNNDTKQAEAVRRDLGKDLFILISPQGKVRSILIDPAMGNLAQSYARAMIALTQFVFPAGQIPESGQWKAQEEDPSGPYLAGYQVCKDKDTGNAEPSVKSFCKKKIRYLEYRPKTKTGPIEAPKTIIPEGEFIARFDFASGALSSLKGSESQVILVNNKKVGQVTNNFRIASLKKEMLKASEVASLKNLFSTRAKTSAPVSLFARPTPEKAEASIQKRELGDSTLESLLADLKKAESAADPDFNSTALYLKFKSLIYLQPESCKHLGKVLGSAGAKSLTMSLLPKALSTIGHPQAQAALVEAIRAHSQDKIALFALINPLATVSEPTQQAEETLWNLAFNSRDPEIVAMAQLALGAQARSLAATSPERVAKIVDRFTQEIKGSPSPQVTQQLLLALGNAGSSRALPTISRFVTDSSADLRAIALHALRFIDSPQAETLLLKALSSDQDSSVRIAAATSMGYREMTKPSFKAQAQIFSKDSNVTVRLKVLENLWKSHETFPEVRNLVKKAASEDRSEEIRNAARNIMSQYPNIFKGNIT